MKNIIFLFILCLPFLAMGQPRPQKQPADPDYAIPPAELYEMQKGGIVLPPVMPAYDRWKNFSYETRRDIPAYYDLRGSGFLTPIKSQSSGGCWAYSTMGAIESRLLMEGLGEYNLSDNNLKFCHGYIPARNTNGNHWMSSAYFARRSGPYLESEDPYPGGTNSNDNCPTEFSARYYINEARYPPSQDITYLKQTVLDYGLVWSLLYYNASYFNTGDNTYFYGGSHAVNHAGCIVGWNDTVTTAGGTGAWIVRNTYGQGWGEGGYYYLSYNDSQFGIYNGFWPEVMGNEPGTHIYQYDEIGGYWGVGFNTEIGFGLVKFETGERDNEISQIGSFIVSTNCGVEIKVYDHFQDSLYGFLGGMDEQIVELPGYYTFDLDSTIHIPAGEDFYVQIRYDSNDPEDLWPIAIEDTISSYAMPQIESGRYWIAPNPEIWPTYWYPVGQQTDFHYDLCIKAYAHELYQASGTLSYDDSLQSPADSIQLYIFDALDCCLDSAFTNGDGNFIFPALKSGSYSLGLAAENNWNGVNSSDALAVALHFNAIPNFALEGLALLAADVNGDMLLDSLDAELIQERTIGLISAFPVNDAVIDNNSITISNEDISKQVKFLYRGDANRSAYIDLD